MNIYKYSDWHFNLFPQTIWYSSPNSEQLRNAFLVFVGLSALYVVLSFTFTRLTETRARHFQRIASTVYIISSIILLPSIKPSSTDHKFILLSPIAELILLQLILLIAVLGSWFIYSKYAESPPLLPDFVKANYWFAVLMYSSFFIPVVLFNMPMIDPGKNIVYPGSIVLALAVHLVFTRFISLHSLQVFHLEIQENLLPGDLQEKFRQASQKIRQYGDFTFHVTKPGIRNALALYPYRRIIIGSDLLKYLSAEEIEAVLLHEYGHLQDKIYVPLLSKSVLFLVVLYLVYVLTVQAKVYSSSWIGFFLFLGGIWIGSVLLKKLKLRGEFVADKFVKDISPASHGHLLSAIDKMRRLNAVDEDFCKKNNYGHLDLDERKSMVESGEFHVQRKPFRALSTHFVPVFVLAFVIAVGYIYYMPSDQKKWKRMHSQYHELKRNQEYEKAAQIITNALHLSVDKFGEFHRRTYISLNDLASVLAITDSLSEAEQYAQQAVTVGKTLYNDSSLQQVRALENIAWIKERQEKWDDAVQYYEQILLLQRQLNETPDKIEYTLSSLIDLASAMKDKKSVIRFADQFVELFRQSSASEPDDSLATDFVYAIQNEFLQDSPEIINNYFKQILKITEDKYGRDSKPYAYILSEYGTFLTSIGRNDEADRQYAACKEIYENIAAKDKPGYIDCITKLGISSVISRDYVKAEKYLFQALNIEEQLYGKESVNYAYQLGQVVYLYQEKGDFPQARQTLQRVIEIKEKYPDVEPHGLLYDYEEMLELLDRTDDHDEIERIHAKIKAIESRIAEDNRA